MCVDVHVYVHVCGLMYVHVYMCMCVCVCVYVWCVMCLCGESRASCKFEKEIRSQSLQSQQSVAGFSVDAIEDDKFPQK